LRVPQPPEPRRDLPVPIRVELRRSDGTVSTEYAINISGGGACLQLREPPQVGERVHLEFALPIGGEPLILRAIVIWCTCLEERGDHARFCETGVRFEHPDEATHERLLQFAEQPVDRRR
jgi:uncharacterized protein (TIGR02266 family)